MRKHFTLILFLLVSSFIASQDILIKDFESHEGISDVFVMSNSETAISNQVGKVTFSSQLTSNDSLTFQHPSYITTKMAYTEVQNAKYQVLLKRKTVSLEEFTVSAHKWERSIDKMPLRVMSMQRDQLAYQPGTSADLLGNTGQVFIQKSQQGGGSPMFRGFAANRLLLVYDGMRVNNAIFRSGNLQNIILFDSKAMESAEVVFGPGSTLYGSDALGGVIDFRTIKPKFSSDSTLLINGMASIGFASASKEGNGHIHFSLGGEKYSSFTSFSFSQFGDLRMGTKGPEEYLRPSYQSRINNRDTILINENDRDQVESGYMQFNLIQKFGFRLSKNLEMGVHFSLAQTGDIPRYDRLIQESDDGLKYAEWYYGPNVWVNAGVSLLSSASTQVFDEWKMRIDYQYYTESRHDRRFNDVIRRNRTERVDGLNTNFDFTKMLSSNVELFYGAEFWYNLVGSDGNEQNIEDGNSDPTSTRYPDGSDYLNGGIYALANWKISKKVNFNAGLRYNVVYMQGVFDTTYYAFPETEFSQTSQALSPSVGLVYRPNEKYRVQFNAGQGFRAPNIDDLAKVFDSSPGNVVVPNTSLDPEKVWSFDLGFTWMPVSKFQFEISGFYSILSDIMIKSDYSINGQDSIMYDGELSKVEAIQNLGDGWIYGVESSLKASISTNFSLRANIVYTQGEDGLGDPLRHVTPLMSSLHFVYLNRSFRIDLNARVNGEISYDQLANSERDKAYIYAIDENGNPYSPSWYTLNIQGSWFISNSLRLDLAIENILNERYRPYSSGISAAGTNVKMSLIAHF